MPTHDLKYCIRDNGNVYCWDDANERIVTVTINDIELSECPERVIKLMMRQRKNKAESAE